MIRIEGLGARHGEFELADISFAVPAGASVVVLGPSGAGKTLLLETLLGLRPCERGRVLIDDLDITDLPPERRGMSYLPQHVALFPHLSVLDNILFGTLARRPSPDTHEQLQRLASLLHLEPVLSRRRIRSLSGGESQRVALARALIVKPRILVLDECFSALDAALRRQLQLELLELRRAINLTMLMVTHDQEEAFLLADQLAILMRGRLVQFGPPGELYARPANLEVAEFLGLVNVLPLQADGASTPPAWLPAVETAGATGATHLVFAPAEASLLAPHCAPPDDCHAVLCTVERVADLGHRRRVYVRPEGAGLTIECALPPETGNNGRFAPHERALLLIPKGVLRPVSCTP